MFDIELSSHAKKFLKRADKELVTRIIQKIEILAEDPFPPDAKRIVNRKDKLFRIRVGDYRIQYSPLFSKSSIRI